MKKIFIPVLFAAFAVTVADARQRTQAEMKAAALNVIAPHGTGARSIGDIKVLESGTQLSLVGFENGSFAVIANDDTFSPVLGYTTVGNSGAGHAPGFLWWLETMNKSLEDMLANGATPARVARSSSSRTAVEPLLTTKWGQGAPYNNLCPEYTDGGETKKYVTGCVATAMAQVMNYHKYPVQGTGSTSYQFNTGDGTVRLSADFGGTVYDWDNMLDDYSTAQYSDVSATAVATLMYHCGVSIQMQYSRDGSGAMSYMACRALKNYFGYSANIGCLYRDYFNEEEWMQIIYRELSDGCPIIYGGSTSSNAGHSFVLDGYDEDGLVSVNWGWNGLDNGYFDVAYMNSYSEAQDMVVVRTANDTRFTDRYQSIWGLYNSLTVSRSGNNLTVGEMGLACFDTDDIDGFCGKVSLVAENLGNGDVTDLQDIIDNSDFYRYGFSDYFNCPTVSIAALPDGEYRLYPASMSEYSDQWCPVRSKEGIRNSYLLTVSGSAVTLTPESSSAWTDIVALPAPDESARPCGVYTLDGRYAGSSFSGLPAGIYITGGRKVVRR